MVLKRLCVVLIVAALTATGLLWITADATADNVDVDRPMTGLTFR
jgi:hypothetical protein